MRSIFKTTKNQPLEAGLLLFVYEKSQGLTINCLTALTETAFYFADKLGCNFTVEVPAVEPHVKL